MRGALDAQDGPYAVEEDGDQHAEPRGARVTSLAAPLHTTTNHSR